MKTEEYIERNLKGFEGDSFIKAEIQKLIDKFEITRIIETGTYLGGTTRQFAQMVKTVTTIELNDEHFNKASENLKECKNVFIHKGSSPEFLKAFLAGKFASGIDDNLLFFLDAHWGNYCPLLDELKIIAEFKLKPVIVIHDFKVPNRPDLGFDSYNGQDLDYNYIHASLMAIYGEKDFNFHYNTEAEGAKRGVIYIYPHK